MPELPEVQTVVDGLNSLALPCEALALCELRPGTVQVSAEVRWPLRFTHATRRGKYILLHTDTDLRLLAHLRMTGKFVATQPLDSAATHVRAVLELAGGGRLWFVDPRTFGTLELLTAAQAESRLAGLGPEPLEKSFDSHYLQAIFQKRKAPVKNLLLRQDIIAGLGNIYVCEILHEAGIDPRREGRSLDVDELERLVSATRDILSLAIAHNGTTIDDFRRVDDKTGEFQRMLRVYGKSVCDCGAPVIRIVQAGRGTWWCPSCQH
ncbi:MAG: bifunctional DNA-formamidopyrimidine glycosylase/DNA-(apurinic or apyrimidinic site) lyase [Candidatus Cloacimonetes bacterium]|nr:bifunctional DNA-formamidopyrimidine glycosylase/DNA-(apurinic or apyrimidinic site) lyase [Candidatus Cloacimonadota bacterium]